MEELRTIISKIGREYSIVHNSEMDINIIMDCMAQEIETQKIDIEYKYVNYVHGFLENLSNEDIMYYINKYEETL